MIFKYALKEVLFYKRFSILYILGSVLGSLGVTLVLFYGSEVAQQIRERSKNILSADFSISARRSLPESELKKFELEMGSSILERSEMFEFFAMVGQGEKSRLVLVKAIDHYFPFYGQLTGSQGQPLWGKQLSDSEIWVYPEVRTQLEVNVGEKLKLGDAEFLIKESVERDQTQTFRLAQLAPRVFINLEGLKKTNLLKPGSTFTQAYLYKLSEKSNVELILKTLSDKFRDATVSFASYRTASEASARQFKLFSDFLTLSALIGFLIALFGQFFINQSFIRRRLNSFSYLRLQGANSYQVQGIVIFEMILLGTVSSAVAILLSLIAVPYLNGYLGKFLYFNANMQSYWPLFAISFSLTIFNSFISFIPFRKILIETSPRSLLSGFSEFIGQGRLKLYLLFLFIFLFGIAILISRSWRFALTFMGVILFTFFVAQSLLWLLSRPRIEKFYKNWKSVYMLRSIRERSFSYRILLISLLISIVFVSLLPQIKLAIESEIRPDTKEQPSLFVFDIQEEQWPELAKIFEQESLKDFKVANLVRARIISINNQAYERADEDKATTREEESEARSRNRGVNMTIKGELNSSEELVQGSLFKESGPEVSLEIKYAERMKINLGDQLKFDIQGVETLAKVTSFRKVNWNSFFPNFFIVFKPGFIDDAPKTYLAALPKTEKKNEIQKILFQRFPNISAIDLDRFISEGVKLFDEIAKAFTAMAYLSLLLGLLVFSIILIVSLEERKREFSLLRLLGVTKSEVRTILLMENLFLVSLCAVLGSAVSIIFTWVLMRYIFESNMNLNLGFYVQLVLGILALVVCIVFFLSRTVTSKNPLEMLRD